MICNFFLEPQSCHLVCKRKQKSSTKNCCSQKEVNLNYLPINKLLISGFIFLFISCQSAYVPDAETADQLPEKVSFNFHVKPILSDYCFSCHGPDKNTVEADLQLHTSAGALHQKLSSNKRAFVAGNIQSSEAFQRIISTDPDLQMPPPDFKRNLSNYEKALIAKWIEQGAEYEPHWAFAPPQKPKIPEVNHTSWAKNPIDYFVLKKLEDDVLQPKEEAEKEILIRRVSLDLRGLPPTIEEIDVFLSDNSPDAYEKLVDRFLQSPHFGERMALFWLDLARYADSNGYSQDGLRRMWPWRDWVIKAFNENMPYDQFISWQLAGDKFSDATQDQRLATGFLRNHRQNGEGGIIDEEYRVEYVADRTETTATVFLGMTMQCARCHDHKYDPISQEEYYQLFSFFNSVHELGHTANDANSGPEVVLTPKEVAKKIHFIDKLIEKQEAISKQIADTISTSSYQNPQIDLEQDLIVDLSFDRIKNGKHINEADLKEVFPIPETMEQVKGVSGNAIRFSAFDVIGITNEAIAFDRGDAFSFSFYLKLEEEHPFISMLNHLGSKPINNPGYEVAIVEGYPMIRLAHSLPANLIEVRGTQKLNLGEWIHLTFTYDGSGKAGGIKLFQNGKKAQVAILFDKLTQGIKSGKKTLTIGGKIGYQTYTDGYGFMDELKIYHRCISSIEASLLYKASSKVIKDFPDQEKKQHYLSTKHEGYHKAQEEIHKLRKQKFQAKDTLMSVMVMEDLPEPRPTFVLNRGVYDAPENQVYAGTPKSILPSPTDSSANRFELANWLLNVQNPLTARVAVNRFWQLLFGRGLVKTTEDFGNQGTLPSHPALLDWLAVHFRESGWDVKGLLKMIVMSSTYRQSSRTAIEERAQDPDNQTLARGPSGRLPAELIRDLVLSASGLLTDKIGGPSVKPYQPEGLWEEKGQFTQLKYYHQSSGEDLYRRSLYTFWRRTSPPPSMVVFDAPTRDICIVNRQATNTPLQALVLMNDPQFVEAARVLAEKIIRENSDKKTQVEHAYRSLTSLFPKSKVIDLLIDLAKNEQQKYEARPSLSQQLLQVGEYPIDTSLNPAEVASMTIVCSTIMSFDECIMKR